jgi:Flp pilus assembly protein TadD
MPTFDPVHNNLAVLLAQHGRLDEAIVHFRKTLELKPEQASAHTNLGAALFDAGQAAEAIVHYRHALALQGEDLSTLNNLAWALATSPDDATRNGAEAVALAEKAVRLAGESAAGNYRTLAAALAEAGRFSEAVQAAQHANRLATSQGNLGLAAVVRAEVNLYRAERPNRVLREPAK